MDLDAYLKRISYTGPLEPHYETLEALLGAHMTGIPFENLDVLLGRGVRLDLDNLQAKLVTARRGGYCFEHCTLFQAVLQQLGFRTAAHAARVVLVTPLAEAPRTHMFLTVETPTGRFMVDPGFGGHAPRLPIRVEDGAEARLGHERWHFARGASGWVMRTQIADRFVEAWVSTLEAEQPIDFELANHYTATHAKSPFTSRLLMRSFSRGKRVTVMNRDLTVGTEIMQMPDRAALRGVLREHFGFDLNVTSLRVPSVPEWQ
jgi:N-hydroxyarylamine O-acetyltransferase